MNSLNKYTAIRTIPSPVQIAESPKSTVEWYSSDDQYKYWALLVYCDNSVYITSYCGKYEDECHGGQYSIEDAKNYANGLLNAGFIMHNAPGDMSNTFEQVGEL